MNYEEATYVVNEISAQINKGEVVPPLALKLFCVNNSRKANTAVINFIPPDDQVIDDKTYRVVGVAVVRKEGTTPPAGVADGTLVLNARRKPGANPWGDYDDYEDTGVENGHTYSYMAYAFGEEGIADVYTALTQTITISKINASTSVKIYGYHHDFEDSDPDTNISYIFPTDIYGVSNRHYEPFVNNAQAHVAGDWGEFLSEELNNHPFVLRQDGTVLGQLKDDDYDKYVDGTTATNDIVFNFSTAQHNVDTTDPSVNSNGCYAWFEKIYIKEVYDTNGNYRDVYFTFDSDFAHANGFHAQGFINNNAEIPGLWLPMVPNLYYGGYKANNTRYDDTGTFLPLFYDPNHSTVQTWWYFGASGATCIKQVGQLDTIISAVNSYNNDTCLLGGAIMNTIRDIVYMIIRSTNDQEKLASTSFYTEGAMPNLYPVQQKTGNMVYGFLGSIAGLTAPPKMFHSIVLGCVYAQTVDLYITFDAANEKILYATDYNTVNDHFTGYDYVDMPLGNYSVSELQAQLTHVNNPSVPTKTVYLADGFGSIPDINVNSLETDDSLNLASHHIVYAISTSASLETTNVLNGDDTTGKCLITRMFSPTHGDYQAASNTYWNKRKGGIAKMDLAYHAEASGTGFPTVTIPNFMRIPSTRPTFA